MVEIKLGEQEEKYKITVMAILLAIACFLTYYFHVILGIDTVFTHFFYVPVVLASLWWKRKGLVVAIFLALLLILSHIFFREDVVTVNDYLRAFMFIVIALVVTVLSEHIAKKERTLEEREHRYRALFERTNDAVFVISLDGIHLAVNQQAADMLGYEVDELTGMPIKQVVSPDEYKDTQNKLVDLLAGKSIPIYERTFRRKDGTESKAEINVVLVYDTEGNPLHIQSIVRDITERKKAEELLKKQKEELSTFAHTVSHDLKNYIGFIRNYAQFSLLKKEYAEKNTQRIIDMTKKMEKFVTRQLQLADAGKAIGKLEEIDLNKLIDEVRKTYTIEMHREELPKIKGDSQRLKEVFHNLFDNAIKQGEADKMEISSEKKKDTHIIYVKDNGRGIPKEDIDKIFDMGYSKIGTGFGLTIVKKIIEAHNGTISVKSKEGEGTTFEISLPIKA